MQFIITAYDAKDENALARRMSVRAEHLENMRKVQKRAVVHCAGGILNESGLPAGSFLIMEFENREAFDEYLASEPYVVNKVWQDIRVDTCNVVIENNLMVGK